MVGRPGHSTRRRAGQRRCVTVVIGETDAHLDSLALVVVSEGVGLAGGIRDIRVRRAVDAYPLVGVARAGQTVCITDPGDIHAQRLTDIECPNDYRQACRRVVGRPGYRSRRGAGQTLGVTVIIGEADLNLYGLPLVVVGEGVGLSGGPGDVRVRGAVIANPLVGVTHSCQTVSVTDPGGVRSQCLPDLLRARDGWQAGGGLIWRCGVLRCGCSRNFGPLA